MHQRITKRTTLQDKSLKYERLVKSRSILGHFYAYYGVAYHPIRLLQSNISSNMSIATETRYG